MTTALRERNRSFYAELWSSTRLQPAEAYNTWALLAPLATAAERRLEIGPGMRPRLPPAGGCVVDQSAEAVAALRRAGARAVLGDVLALPFRTASFDLVAAFDVVEHVADDLGVFAEIGRVLAPGGHLVLAVPLHPALFDEFDEIVGHHRRYEPAELLARLDAIDVRVVRSAAYGMTPRNPFVHRLGIWWLKRHRAMALRWWDRACGLAIRRQPPLAWAPGMVAADGVDEVVLLCARPSGGTAST